MRLGTWRRLAVAALLVLGACGEEHEHGHEDHEGQEEGRHGGGAGGADLTVRISPQAVERNDIRTAEVARVAVTGGVEAPAEVQLPPDRLAHVTSLVSGQLERIDVTVGDRVEPGETLAILHSVELGDTRSALSRAQAEVEVARSNFERQEELDSEGIGARRDYLEAQAELRRAEAELSAARRRLAVYGGGGSGSSTLVKSPIAGTVLDRHATVGEVVDPNRTLFTVGDPSYVWVVGRVYPQDVTAVEEGAPATLSLQSGGDQTWTGTLDYVAPALDQGSRTMPVRMILQNPDGDLRPGLFGTLSITPARASAEPVPTIEWGAVQRLEDREVVFVPADEEGVFRAVPVELGSRTGGLVEVRSGLETGDAYVADGGFVLKSELLRARLGHGHAH